MINYLGIHHWMKRHVWSPPVSALRSAGIDYNPNSFAAMAWRLNEELEKRMVRWLILEACLLPSLIT